MSDIMAPISESSSLWNLALAERGREKIGFHLAIDIDRDKMQKLGFPSTKSTLDKFKSLYGSSSSLTAKNSSFSSRPSSDSISLGSFANLKLTAGSNRNSALPDFIDFLVVEELFDCSMVFILILLCFINLLMCRETGERASFREDWSGNRGMISGPHCFPFTIWRKNVVCLFNCFCAEC